MLWPGGHYGQGVCVSELGICGAARSSDQVLETKPIRDYTS